MRYDPIACMTGILVLSACATQSSHTDPAHEAGAIVPSSSSSSAAAHAGHAQGDHQSHSGPGISGYAPLRIDPARAAGLGLATARVEERDFTKTLRTTGVVTVDETRTAHVHAKVRGWIEGIRANFIGRKVKRGEALCSVYSQEVFAAELEFLALLDRAPGKIALGGEFAQAEAQAQTRLLDAARRRLALWDVPKAEIARLETTREARRTFALVAPRPGVVVAKQAIEGMYVDPSMELYVLSDLSRVWVLADVYETEVPYVHVGDHAQLAVEGREHPIHAKVAFIPPTLDERTRTLKVRFELDNPNDQLRPGAFVSAVMNLQIGKGLAVPEVAVIRTGSRAIVFVVHGEHAEPREIVLGPLVGSHYRVNQGLVAGEEVATSAQFLLDSESRLRATSAPAAGHVH